MTDESTSADSDFEIAEAAPVDEDGHPVHPDEDKSHRICAAKKSERTTPTDHGRERDDVEYCLLAAGWGVDGASEGACKHHLGAVDNRGENNPAFKHGAFSEYFTDHLVDTEKAAFDEAREMLEEPESAQEIARQAAAICLVKFKRSGGDERFLRRFESLCDKFGIAPEDELTVHHEGLEDAFMSNLKGYYGEAED